MTKFDVSFWPLETGASDGNRVRQHIMNWYAQQRADWIEEMLKIYGFINRHHICAKFGCSPQAAGKDLTAFAANNTDWVQYQPRKKAYVKLKTGA